MGFTKLNFSFLVSLVLGVATLSRHPVVFSGQVARGGSMGVVVDENAPIASGAKYVPAAIQSLEGGNPNQDVAREVISDRNFVDCDQSCFYQKANENISLQYRYIVEKLEFLDSSVPWEDKNPSNPNNSAQSKVRKGILAQQKREVLGPFCNASELSGPVDEEPTRCIERYRKTMDFFLLKIRTSLAVNNESRSSMGGARGIGRYQGTPVEKGDVYLVPGQGSTRPQIVKNQVTYFSKSKDLGKFVRPVDIQRMLTQNVSDMKPKLEDFFLFEKILRDPDDPLRGEFIVPKRVNGVVQHDQEAFQAALTAWQGAKGAEPGVRAELMTRIGEAGFAAHFAQSRETFKRDFAQATSPEARSVGRKIYDESRRDLIDQASGNIGVGGKPQANRGRQPTASVRDTLQAQLKREVSFKSPTTGEEEVINPNPTGPERHRFSIQYSPVQIGTSDPSFMTKQHAKEQQKMLEMQRAQQSVGGSRGQPGSR